MKQTITILGATGSIGRSTADVMLRHPDRFETVAVVGGRDAAALADTARRLGARFAALADDGRHAELKDALAGSGIQSGAGESAVLEAATLEADTVVAGISGAAGLAPTHAALRLGRRIALANKESLVCAGDVFMRDARRYGARILPVDSEHNALQQALGSGPIGDVVKMTITATGGPFRTWPKDRIRQATPQEAGRHPVWAMGAKINIDSATLMNKGLELIEAHHLFGLPPDRLDVLVHPQAIVHGLVHWRDGSVTVGMALPDMRTPIAHCLALDERLEIGAPGLDLAAIGSLSFDPPDEDRFPCLALARTALGQGGAMPTILNAANEVAVHAFMAGEIGFMDIADRVARACEIGAGKSLGAPASIEEAIAIDEEARRWTRALPAVAALH